VFVYGGGGGGGGGSSARSTASFAESAFALPTEATDAQAPRALPDTLARVPSAWRRELGVTALLARASAHKYAARALRDHLDGAPRLAAASLAALVRPGEGANAFATPVVAAEALAHALAARAWFALCEAAHLGQSCVDDADAAAPGSVAADFFVGPLSRERRETEALVAALHDDCERVYLVPPAAAGPPVQPAFLATAQGEEGVVLDGPLPELWAASGGEGGEVDRASAEDAAAAGSKRPRDDEEHWVDGDAGASETEAKRPREE
jgi:hypothetical protein